MIKSIGTSLQQLARNNREIEEAATFHLNLTKHESPEHVTLKMDKAAEMGLPYPLVAQLDNNDLQKPLSAASLSPRFQRFLADNVYQVPMFRDQLDVADLLVRSLVRAGQPRQQVVEELNKQYETRGVPYPKRLTLEQRGYKEISEGKYLKDGEVLQSIATTQDVMGDEERKKVGEMFAVLRDRVDFSPDDLAGFPQLSETGKKSLLARYSGLLQQEAAVLTSLFEGYGGEWRDWPDHLVRSVLNRIGKEEGVDLSGINIDRLRKGGVSTVDWAQAVNLFGVVDLWRFASDNTSPEQLAAIDGNSPIKDQLAKIKYLAEYGRDLRGRTVAAQVTQTTAAALPFIAEIFLTQGVSSVARQGGKVALKAAVSETLKEAGFSSFRSGAKAIFTKAGWRGIRDAAGQIAKGEAKRLPLYTVRDTIRAIEDAEVGPVYYMRNGVKVALSDEEVDMVANVLTGAIRNQLSTYFENTSEHFGNFLPSNLSVTSVLPLPAKWRRTIAHYFLSDLADDATKMAKLSAAFAGAAPVESVLGEIAEEYAAAGMQRISTIVGSGIDLAALDMGRDSWLGSAEEQQVILWSSLVMSGAFSSINAASRVSRYQDAARWIDDHRDAERKLSAMPLEQRSTSRARAFVDEIRDGREVIVSITPDDAGVLLQSDPEMMTTLGVTEDTVAEAKRKGSLIDIEEADILVEQAKSPAAHEAGERIIAKARFHGDPLEGILDANFGQEILDAIALDQDRLMDVQQRIYSKLEISHAAGVSKRSLQALSRMMAVKVLHLQDNYSDPAEIDRAVDRLMLKVYKDESQAARDWSAADYIEGIVNIIAPQGNESKAEVAEDSPSNDAWILPDDVAETWSDRVNRYIQSFMASSKNSGVVAYLDEGSMYDEAMRAINKAYAKYDPASGPFENFANRVIKNRIADIRRRAILEARRGTRSLNEELGDEGATLADVTPDTAAQAQGSRLSSDEEATLLSAIEANLKPKQIEIWRKTLEGKSQSEIADEIGVSHQYVSKVVAAVRSIARQIAMRHLGMRNQENLNQKSVTRGFFWPGDDFNFSFNAVIGLFKGRANVSTVVHESAHWLLRMMESLVAMQDDDGNSLASDQLQKELDSINKWLDRQRYKAPQGTEAWFRERDEKFARAFEEYVLHHKAPNSTVAAAFNTLKRFLTAIYRHCVSLPELYDFEMSPDIAATFDSILTVDEIVKRDSPLSEAAISLGNAFDTLFASTADERADALHVLADARVSILNNTEKAYAAAVEKLRRVWRKAAIQAMKGMRVYEAWSAVENKDKEHDGRLSVELLSTMVDPDTANALRKLGLAKRGGQDPALLAEKLGYGTPAEMARDLLSATPPADFIASYVAKAEAKFSSEYELGAESLGTQANIKLIDLVIDKLRSKVDSEERHDRRAAVSERVRKHIAGSRVSWVLSDKQALRSLKAANRDLISAFSNKDYASALTHAEAVRYNLELMRQKADAKRQAEATLRKLKRAVRARKGLIFENHQLALREIAYYTMVSERELEDPKTNYRKKVAEAAAAEGGQAGWPEWMFDDTKRDYKDMNYAAFEELSDFVDSIYWRGREYVKTGKEGFFSRARDRIASCVDVLSQRKHKYHARKETLRDIAASATRRLLTTGHTLRLRFAEADGYTHIGKDAHTGPFIEMWDLLNEAFSRASNLMDTAELPCKEAVRDLYNMRDKIVMPSVAFTGKAADYYSKWTPEMVISACLNMGNKINRQRLRDGFGWSEEDLASIASCMPKPAWDQVQKIWDALAGQLQDRVAATFLKENYYRLKLVPADSFSVRTSDGSTHEVKGGYYPIKYCYTPAGKMEDIAEELREQHHEVQALYKPVDSLKKRAESPREVPPIKLSMSVPIRHIADAAMYAETRLQLREVLYVVSDQKFRDEFQQTQSYEAYKDIYAILRNMANPTPETEGVLDSWESWARTVFTASALMFNARSIGMQFTSATVGLDEVGSYYVDVLGAYAASPFELREEVAAKSAMMRNRSRYFDADLQSQVAAFSSKLTKAQVGFAKIGYFGMHMTDGIVSSVMWMAKYRQSMDKYQTEGLSPEDAESKAVADADGFVARTQGATRLIDIPPIRLNQLGRLISPFLTPANAQFNYTMERLGAWRAGRLDPAEAFGSFAGNILAPSLLTSLVTVLMTDKSSDDDDAATKLWARVLRDALTNPFSGIPIVGNAVNVGVSGTLNLLIDGAGLYQNMDLLDAGAFQSVSELFSRLVGGGRAMSKGEWERALWTWADVLSTAYRMPVLKTYKRALDLWSGLGLDIPDAIEEFNDTVSP